MSGALICGSMAFDTIMVFHDAFKNHILPDKVHILNVSFLVPDMRREFGGCAGNIAYNLNLLGGNPVPMATVGRDFAAYASWLDDNGIDRRFIKKLSDSYTAQAFITTDMDDNQITAFHPGAMNQSHLNSVSDASKIAIGMVSPDGRQGMMDHARQFAEADIPFIFDPGQGMPMFNGEELMQFVEQATWVTVNDYEGQMLQERTGKTPQEIAEHVQALIVTRGGNGSTIYSRGRMIDIPSVQADTVADPTGCGDAYRAGLLFGLQNDMDWDTTGRIASLLGALKVAHNGTQNHRFDIGQFAGKFKQAFGYNF